MLKEGYISLWRKYPENEIKVRVARPSVLSPSEQLLKDYKEGRIDWNGYERRFREEILSRSEALEKMREVKTLSETEDVRLICYEKPPKNCHRFILIDMIKEMEE